MEFVYTSAISKIRALKKRKKIIQGGQSAGKTIAILSVLIDKAAKTPGIEISVVSHSVPHLRRGALKDFLKLMKITKRYVDSRYNRSLLTYTFANGSYIEFFSAEFARGPRRNVLYINEADKISFESYNELASRTNGEIYIDFNPVQKFWVHNDIVGEADADFLVLTYQDNEALDEVSLNEMHAKKVKALTSKYWERWWKVYGEGQIGTLDGVVYSNWKQIDEMPVDDKGQLIPKLVALGLDFGYSNDPTACVAIYKYDGFIILDEIIYKKQLTNSQIALMIKQAMPNYQVCWCDSAEPKSIYELNANGVRAAGVTKGPDSINYGISILQEYEMLVTSRSVNLINELENYTWFKDAQGNSTNKPIDAFCDLLDAARYVAMMSLKASNGNKIRVIKR